MRNGKGDEPRNVGPKFQKNFPAINWGSLQHASSERRTSTKRIYTYGGALAGATSAEEAARQITQQFGKSLAVLAY